MSRFLIVLAILGLIGTACNGDPTVEGLDPEPTPAEEAEYDVADQPGDAAARFASPEDDATVTSPVQIVMEAEGVEIVPAGPPAVGEGHFHINVDIGCVDEGDTVPGPSDETRAEGYLHFGDGSTETELELEPGTYELCLQLADGLHVTFGETQTIEITVE